MDYVVVIPAAGVGKRMGLGKNKLLISMQEIPIIVHTIKVFEEDEWCRAIILVINKDDRMEIEKLMSDFQFKKIRSIVDGGKERQESVHYGLKNIKEDSVVLIHDGARPFVKEHHIHQLVEKANEKGAAILAVPVKDTIKKVQSNIVKDTIERSSLWLVQTPQAFHVSLIKGAYELAEKEDFLGTDDASLVERFGKEVAVVEGDYDNIKITTQEDLYFAEAILKKRLNSHRI